MALAALSRKLRALSQVPSRVAPAFSSWATKRMRSDIRAGQDPYGIKQPSLKESTIERKGHSTPNIDSRALIGSIEAVPMSGAGVILKAGPAHGRFALSGTVNHPARPFFPRGRLPESWRIALAKLIKKILGTSL